MPSHTWTKNNSVMRAKYEVFSYQYMSSRKDPSLSQNIAASLELSKNICSMLLFTTKTKPKTWFYLIVKFSAKYGVRFTNRRLNLSEYYSEIKPYLQQCLM